MATIYHVNQRMFLELERLEELLARLHGRGGTPQKPDDSVRELYNSGVEATAGSSENVLDGDGSGKPAHILESDPDTNSPKIQKKYSKRNPAMDEGNPTRINDDTRVAESGNVPKPQVVYLENVNDLEAAVKGASAGGIVIVKKQNMMKKAMQIDANVTFQSGFTGTDAMFKVDVDDIEAGELGYLSWSTSDVSLYTEDGSGGDARDTDTEKVTLIEAAHGRLCLRGNTVLKNCDTAVLVQATADNTAQVEVNCADISAKEYAIKLMNEKSNFFLGALADDEVTIGSTVYLAAGSYITVEAAVPSSGITVECENPYNGCLVAIGNNYTLSTADRDHFKYADNDFVIDRNSRTNTLVTIPF